MKSGREAGLLGVHMDSDCVLPLPPPGFIIRLKEEEEIDIRQNGGRRKEEGLFIIFPDSRDCKTFAGLFQERRFF